MNPLSTRARSPFSCAYSRYHRPPALPSAATPPSRQCTAKEFRYSVAWVNPFATCASVGASGIAGTSSVRISPWPIASRQGGRVLSGAR